MFPFSSATSYKASPPVKWTRSSRQRHSEMRLQRRVFRRVPPSNLSPIKAQGQKLVGPHRGWRILLVEKRGRTPTLPGAAVRSHLHPLTPTSIVTSMSETGRSRGSPSVPETPSNRPPQNSPESVLLDLPACVSFWRKSYKASACCTSMGDETRCTFENCKTLRMTRSSKTRLQSSLCAGKGVL